MSNFDSNLSSYYPCSTLLLDDDESFVLSLKRCIGRKWPVYAFTSPGQALKKIHLLQECAKEAFNLLSAYHSFPENVEQGDEIVLLNSSRIRQFVESTKRYEIISVIVIDQVMPQVSGLEFCAQLGKTGIKKILLTGQMNDADTIEAFNNGLIDRYINKNDPNATAKLLTMIDELHREYLRERLESTMKALNVTGSHFLKDFAVKKILNNINEFFNFTEYHYVPFPRGYLLINEVGDSRFCLLSKEEEQKEIIEELIELYQDDESKADIIHRIKNEMVIVWELSDDLDADLDWQDDLGSLVFPCDLEDGILWSLIDIEEMPNKIDFDYSWLDFIKKIRSEDINSIA